MSRLTQVELPWLYQQPSSSARIRVEPEDFIVKEDLGYEPEGEGEHHYLYIRKRGENTDWVARQLANFCQVSPRDVAYAGKKDRHALTEQWFSVHLPGSRRVLNWALFGGDSIQVLKASKHKRKIKLGNLRGNRFAIRLRELTQQTEFASRLEHIKNGVPNYFGEQRFGQEGGNLVKGLQMLNGELDERQRVKRGLYISAVRSQLFNTVVAARLNGSGLRAPLQGDVLIEPYTQKCEHWDRLSDSQTRRFEANQSVLSAPLWGKGELYTQDEARIFEQSVLTPYQAVCDQLASLGLRQERRAALLVPQRVAVHNEADGQWVIEFDLPSGCFATSVLRELCSWSNL